MLSRSHAPAWECIHYADRSCSHAGAWEQGDGCIYSGLAMSMPNSCMADDIPHESEQFLYILRMLSRSHAPAWECIHYADRSCSHAGAWEQGDGCIYSGLAMSMPNSCMADDIPHESEQFLYILRMLSRSHAPAWECIHYADRSCSHAGAWEQGDGCIYSGLATSMPNSCMADDIPHESEQFLYILRILMYSSSFPPQA